MIASLENVNKVGDLRSRRCTRHSERRQSRDQRDHFPNRRDMSARSRPGDTKDTHSVLPPPTICTSSMITRYHSQVTKGLLCLSIFTYDTPSLLGRLAGGRATCKSFFRTLYVVIHTSYSSMCEHHSSLLSSGAGVSSSSKRALLFPREVAVDFDRLREAAEAVLERIELNFDHPS